MKAIQIKYLPGTKTHGARLRALTDAGKLDEIINDYGMEIEDLAYKLAECYLKEMGWDKGLKISGFGSLCNGDWVATLKENK